MPDRSFLSKLKRALIVLIILTISFFTYVEIVNHNSRQMTFKQKIFKAVYPAWMWLAGLQGKKSKKLENIKQRKPPISFYGLRATRNNGKDIDFATLKGKKVLLVNTASNCGYTNQYDDLQKLSEQFRDKLVVIGFPANDFKDQEKGTDEEIAEFCKLNFGVTFALAKKSVVVKSPEQNSVFQWLTDSTKNGWCNEAPVWNFSKYIVDENGILLGYFGPTISPLSPEIKKALQ
jgi:glutathione peroxidase